MTVGETTERTAARPPPAGRRFPSWAAGVVLALLVFAAYANTFQVPFLFDDTDSITTNYSLRHFRTAWSPPSNSGITPAGRPLLNLSLAANYAVHGIRVPGYHLVNVSIHTLSVLVLFGLVRRMLLLPSVAGKISARSDGIAFAVAAVWGLHPLLTESVTYISQRAESLVSFLYLLTLYAFVRVVTAPVSSWRWRIAVVIACLLGMTAKEVMVSAPIILWCFDRAFVAGSFRAAWRARGRLHLACFATWTMLAACMISTGSRGGTVGFGASISSWRYLLTQCEALVTYLRLAFWPHPLTLDYGKFHAVGLAEVLPQAILLVTLLGATIWAWIHRPMLGFAGVFFFCVLAPSSSVIPLFLQPTAEHRFYLALAPLTILLVTATVWLLGSRAVTGWLVVAGALGVVTFQRNADYRSAETIWADTVRKAPGNDRAWSNLGMSLFESGKIPGAREALLHALALAPEDPETLLNYGQFLARTGDVTGAETTFRTILKITPQEPDAHYNLGVLLADRGRSAEAAEHFAATIAVKPTDVSARYNLANTLVLLDRVDEALPHYRVALELDPGKPDVRNNYARSLLRLGRATEALDLLGQSTATTGDLQLTRSLALVVAGRRDEAVRELQSLLRQNPNWAEAHANLGLALVESGRPAEAAAHYETALRLGSRSFPDRTKIDLQVSLAGLLLQLGRRADAIAHYRAALELAPGDVELRAALDKAQAGANPSPPP